MEGCKNSISKTGKSHAQPVLFGEDAPSSMLLRSGLIYAHRGHWGSGTPQVFNICIFFQRFRDSILPGCRMWRRLAPSCQAPPNRFWKTSVMACFVRVAHSSAVWSVRLAGIFRAAGRTA
ncbi:hypothetical protein N657DRAFT_94300 [Parathielavia appendiculata]|uniref:Uncharacterized protein n=1 Tax=Parathielavia appendiculata TaxID=2587402 RepID=A0AAN6UBT3_9PEZI|nr:hypothetical protein N657DRAFT_94300 [Parathielavia appendiculata]